MSDKTREDFEYWASDDGYNPAAVERSGHGYKLAQIQTYWQAWLAAKEKYEPRWIPVSERLPDYDQEVIWYYEETGVIKIFSFDKDDYPIREWNFPPSHWMPIAPWSTIEPSTQGGGE